MRGSCLESIGQSKHRLNQFKRGPFDRQILAIAKPTPEAPPVMRAVAPLRKTGCAILRCLLSVSS